MCSLKRPTGTIASTASGTRKIGSQRYRLTPITKTKMSAAAISFTTQEANNAGKVPVTGAMGNV